MGITQITPVKGRKEFLFKNIEYWLKQSIDQLVIVDLACPEQSGPDLIKSKYAKDPRLIVVLVDKETAGPFYSHGFARNIGVHAARHDLLFFLDVDCRASDFYIKEAAHRMDREGGADVYCNLPPDFLLSQYLDQLPLDLSRDRQFFIRNAIFYDINGFNQEYTGYAAETYDLLIRAKMRTDNFSYSSMTNLLRIMPHDDTLRDQYLPFSISNGSDYKQLMFKKSMDYYKRVSKLSPRTQPGIQFGITSSNPKALRVYKSGVEMAFRPGDDT